MRRFRIIFVSLTLLLLIVTSACGTTTTPVTSEPPETTEPVSTATENPQVEATSSPEPTVDPEFALEDLSAATFDNPTEINNKYFPMTPGTEYVYDGFTHEGNNKIPHSIVFTVTDLTKEVLGIQTVVAYILDYSDGELLEAEIAFYAQDNDGNVWFMGEYPEVYEYGEVVEAPAWISGLKGAKAGIMMKADPQLGVSSYAQGWGPAINWNDRGRVIALGEKVCVPLGCYEDVLVTEEFSQSEPDAFQIKYYAPGVGNIQVGWRGGDPGKETLELITLTQLSPEAMVDVRAAALELEQSAYEHSKEVYAATAPLEHVMNPEIASTIEHRLLTGQTTMCDLGARLVNFRMVEPVPELTDRTLIVEIADLETSCAVNPTNPSLLTCTIPPDVTFPASVVVNLDTVIVNEFVYEGNGCDELTTPIPTTTP